MTGLRARPSLTCGPGKGNAGRAAAFASGRGVGLGRARRRAAASGRKRRLTELELPVWRRASLDHGDCFHFDEPARLRQGGDANQCGGGTLLAEKFLAYRRQIVAMPNVDEIGRQLHDIRE